MGGGGGSGGGLVLSLPKSEKAKKVKNHVPGSNQFNNSARGHTFSFSGLLDSTIDKNE